jgi:hypothetical protein
MQATIMTEQILKLMAIAPGPQTATELCDSLRRSGVKTEEFQLVEQLRRLQKDGFVRVEGVRWRILKMPPNVSILLNVRPQIPVAPYAANRNTSLPCRAAAWAIW